MNDQANRIGQSVTDFDWDDASPTESKRPPSLAPVVPIIEDAKPRRSPGKRQAQQSPARAPAPAVGGSDHDAATSGEIYSPPSAPRRAAGATGTLGRVPPHSIEAEENLLSCCLLDPADVLPKCEQARVGPQSCYDYKHQIVFACIIDTFARLGHTDVSVVAEELKTSRQLEQIGSYAFLSQITQRIPTTAQATYFIEKVREQAVLREIIRSATGAVEDCYGFSGGIDEFAAEIHAKIATATGHSTQRARNLGTRLAERRFNFATIPAEPIPRFLINGRAVCTPGNLTNLIAQAKAGKSALTGAMLAAAVCAEFGMTDRDTLGVTSRPPGNLRLVHVDTEQSRYDHDQHIRRALRRAGVDEPPAWLFSYGLAGFAADELRQILRMALADAQAAGGVFAVILDGTADLVNDVNDPEECNAFVAELHNLAIEHDCPVINVVHENPGQDGGKMRGHLGSQLERKAESNLRLRKSEEVTVVFSEKMRRAPIMEKDGPRFRWSDTEAMHVSCLTAGATRDDVKRGKLHDLAEAVFEKLGRPTARYAELVKAIGEVRGVQPSTAEDRFSDMKKLGVIIKEMGQWRLSPVTP